MIEIGLKHTSELTVTDAVTAVTIGSGDMPVVATPMMMALMENAAMLAVRVALPEGSTTVGGNDTSMVKAAGIGVAMGNALESLKAVADYTTTSVDEDGIQQALHHFQLI